MVKFLPSKQAMRVRFPLPAGFFVLVANDLHSGEKKYLYFGQLLDSNSAIFCYAQKG